MDWIRDSMEVFSGIVSFSVTSLGIRRSSQIGTRSRAFEVDSQSRRGNSIVEPASEAMDRNWLVSAMACGVL